MYTKFVIVLFLVNKFSANLAIPQNFERDLSDQDQSLPADSIRRNSEPPYGNQGQYPYDRPENQNDKINIGNGYNKHNNVFIDKTQREEANPTTILSNTPRPREQPKDFRPDQYPTNSDNPNYNTPDESVLNFGNGQNKHNTVIINEGPRRQDNGFSDPPIGVNSNNAHPVDSLNNQGPVSSQFDGDGLNGLVSNTRSFRTGGRGIMNINNIGNGLNNRNNVVIQDDAYGNGRTVTVLTGNDNRRRPPYQPHRQYRPQNTPQINTNQQGSRGFNGRNGYVGQTPDYTTFNRIGRGPNNRNLVVINGEVVSDSRDGYGQDCCKQKSNEIDENTLNTIRTEVQKSMKYYSDQMKSYQESMNIYEERIKYLEDRYKLLSDQYTELKTIFDKQFTATGQPVPY